MYIDSSLLEKVAVDQKMFLASNIADLPNCGESLDPKTEIVNRFPLVEWLLRTAYTQRVRAELQDGCKTYKKDGQWVLSAPGEFWSEIPQNSAEECCWQPFEFSKCGGDFPLKLLCLKSCDSMMDIFMDRLVNLAGDVNGIATSQEKRREAKRRVDRLSMAFYTAYTAILGHTNVTSNILKPFNGLAQLMENPAVATINGTNILAAFESVGCRLAILGGEDVVFAVNPVVYQSILSVIVPSQYGQYPFGWTRNGDEIRFHGHPFLQDKLVPVDASDGTGELWVLNGEALGLFLATDLMPGDDYIRIDGDYTKTPANGCAEECIYYYNLGAAVGNNANKVMRIVDIPLSGACTAVIGDLGGLVTPQTLIPA